MPDKILPSTEAVNDEKFSVRQRTGFQHEVPTLFISQAEIYHDTSSCVLQSGEHSAHALCVADSALACRATPGSLNMPPLSSRRCTRPWLVWMAA